MRRRENRVDSALAAGNADPDLTAGVCPAGAIIARCGQKIRGTFVEVYDTLSIALEADLKRLLKSASRSFRSHLTVAT